MGATAPGFVPACPPVQHGEGSQPGRSPPCPSPKHGGRSLSTPRFCKPKPAQCQTGAAHLNPSSRNQVAQLQVPKPGTAPSYGFHQGFTRATREVASPHGSSIRFARRTTTKTQPATPTSSGEVAAGCGFVLPPNTLPGAVSTSWDDSKPWETRPPPLLILNVLLCKAAAVAQHLSGCLAKAGGTTRGN